VKQYVIFNVGSQSFGVDILDIAEIIKPTKFAMVPDAPIYLEGLMDLRGRALPVINLSKRLNIESTSDSQKVVVVQLEKFLAGFLVDDVSEILKIDDENIEKVAENVKGIKRKYVDSVANINDEMIIILNLKNVLTIDDEEELYKIINV